MLSGEKRVQRALCVQVLVSQDSKAYSFELTRMFVTNASCAKLSAHLDLGESLRHAMPGHVGTTFRACYICILVPRSSTCNLRQPFLCPRHSGTL